MRRNLALSKTIVYVAGGAFIGYLFSTNINGAIIGGLIGFIISLRF